MRHCDMAKIGVARLCLSPQRVLVRMLMFWVLAGLLCVATVATLLAVKAPTTHVPDGRSEGALAIYKDQLQELEHEVAAGSLSVVEAESARNEISRRLLAASQDGVAAQPRSFAFPKAIVLAVPALAAIIYWQVGRYGFPDVPRAERLAAAATSNDLEALIAQVEQQLEKQPNDVQGWQLLVPNYLSMGRFKDAANAMDQIARINGPSAELYANMAEAFVFDNQGLMTAQSMLIAREALKLDAKHPKALYYNALGLAQEGKTDEARLAFQSLLIHAPADAPYRAAVTGQLAKLAPSASAPQISAEQMQGAENMKPEDRIAMIRGMVDGLDQKLKDNPQDIEGWLRLIRARTVLNDGDKAASALATARATFAAKPEDIKALDDLAKELKLK